MTTTNPKPKTIMTSNRRQFLLQSGVFIAGSGLLNPQKVLSLTHQNIDYTPKKNTKKNISGTLFSSAYSDMAQQQYIAIFNTQGKILQRYTLPSRGHSFAISQPAQTTHLISISRRPENTLEIINLETNHAFRCTAEDNRHFYGHGVCSHDHRYIYTTENNTLTGEGRIGVRDIKQPLRVVADFPSYGIGPHDIQLSHDGSLLIVANGGVKTLPETGRKKLNITSMQPSLTLIDRQTGKLKRKVQLSPQQHKNSIRHLTIDQKGNIFIALQNQSTSKQHEVLLAKYDSRKDQLTTFAIPKMLTPALQGYLGSIAIDHAEEIIATTSPRGGYILFYTSHGDFLASDKVNDICGVQASGTEGEFYASSGNGQFIRYRIIQQQLYRSVINSDQHTRWDNHLHAL